MQGGFGGGAEKRSAPRTGPKPWTGSKPWRTQPEKPWRTQPEKTVTFSSAFGYNILVVREATSRRRSRIRPGLAKFGIAPGLAACNTPGDRSKSEIPQLFASTGVLVLHPFRKIPENRRLTTSLTTMAETENQISGCSALGSAGGLGPSGRRFKSCHSDQKGGFYRRKAAGIASLRLYCFQHGELNDDNIQWYCCY